MIFDFDSGGASHPEGFGAWRVQVDGHQVTITHTVRDDVTTFPVATLTDDEHAGLWRCVEAIERTPPDAAATRPSPGQPLMTFTVTRHAQTTKRSVSAVSTDVAPGVSALLHFLAELIHRRTGQRPTMG